MSHDIDDPLHVLEREAVPPAHLKGRILRSLRDRTLLRTTTPVWRPLGLTVAAMAAALLVFATGVRFGRPRADTRPSYILFLYEGRDFQLDRSRPGAIGAYEAEYNAWAAGMEARGVGVQGRALALTGHLLRDTPEGVQIDSGNAVSAQGWIDGFFIIRVTDEAEAVAIARTHPHLHHGGWIALRPIKPAS